MGNFLQNENHLIVWPLLQESYESDLSQGYIALRARYDMTTDELFQSCLEAWKVNNDKNYQLILVRVDGEKEVPLNCTVKEAGLRNGDYLHIKSA
jgi:hypothetical protein